MSEHAKTFKRETAVLFMLFFWALVGWVTFKDFPEQGVQLVQILIVPTFAAWAAAFGMDWWSKQK